MEQKASLLKKRPIAVKSEVGISIKGTEEEMIPYDKEAALEETVKNLHEQVACLVCECNAKDELMAEHMKTTQEAITGREKAEGEAAKYKLELEDTLEQNIMAYERLVHLNASLKSCRQQLSWLKKEQDQKVNLERAYKRLESKYTEVRKRIANLTLENALLTKALVKKKEMIKDVKDLKMRTLNADVADRQHKESVNLEAERQRLRLLVKKRAPKTQQGNHLEKVDKEMSLIIKKLSEVEEENRSLKKRLCERENEIHILKREIEGKMGEKVLELENKILCLEMEVERVNEFENLKLINVDLDQQLSAAKVEIKEAYRKVSVLEMELEDKFQQYEGLEAACLELQLQLASVSSKEEVTENLAQKGKLIQTGMEIARELTNDKKLSPHSCLRDHLEAEDGFHKGDFMKSPMIKDIISATEIKDPSVTHYNTCNGLKKVVPQALPIVPWKKYCKGTELLRKLLFRRKRGGNKLKLRAFSTYYI